MTTLLDVVNRVPSPAPWAEGDNIPWDEPSFSERMLREHLNQEHDLASRRLEKIERHVDWIHRVVLRGEPTKILDLACGPGLYTNRLAQLGHECVGVDFSPASVAYASEIARREGLHSSFLEEDVRVVSPGREFGLVMMLWGEINVFRRTDAARILSKAHEVLAPGGQLLLEPQTYTQVVSAGEASTSWHTLNFGLFSESPHVVLQESFWDESTNTSTSRFYVIDAETGAITRHALSNVAYKENEITSMLSEIGLREVRAAPSLSGVAEEDEQTTHVLLARK
jgi:SAM-dependent methyltransferase